MALAVGDVVEGKIYCAAPGDIGINVRHYKVTNVTGVVRPQDIVDLYFGYFDTAYANVMPTNCEVNSASLQKIFPLPKEDAAASTVAATPGTIADDLLPRQTCGIITLRTGLAGRKFRGRVYIPFPPENANDGAGQPTPAYLTLLDAIATLHDDIITFAVGLTTISLVPVVFHRLTGTYDQIFTAVTRPRWATQRRRNNNRF